MPGFLNIWMLLGGLLVAVPVAIHLLNRARFRTEAWGAMMFLRKATLIRSQRIKAEQILLMFLRCLFFILLALSLARPFFSAGTGSSEDPTTHMLVVDHSYSMQQGDGEDESFEQARRTALGIVDGMGPADNMLVILAGTRPEPLFPNMSFDKKFLREKIRAMAPGSADTADMAKAMSHAYWRLEQSSLSRHRIYILTDGQRHGWRTDDADRWEKLLDYRQLLKITPLTYMLRNTPADTMRNSAVLNVYPASPIVDTFRSTQFLVEMANYGESRESVHVRFHVDGTLYAERDVICNPGISVIQFDHTFSQLHEPARTPTNGRPTSRTSSHYVSVTIDDDDLVADNSFSLALEVRHSIPILVVEGHEPRDIWDADAGLLSLALDSTAKPGSAGLFDVTRKNLYEVEDADVDALENYKTIVLANVPSFSHDFQFALEQFVERGGGLLMTLGDRIDADAYNRTSADGRGLIPARLTKIRSAEGEPWSPTFAAGAAHSILDLFDVNRTKVLNEIRVARYWDTHAARDARVIARFGESPFIVCRQYGHGRVALWTTAANTTWSNFPLTQDYLPLLQNLAIYLSASVKPPINLSQGDALVYAFPPAPASSAGPSDLVMKEIELWEHCTLTFPDGRQREVRGNFVGGQWVAEWLDTAEAGVYTVTVHENVPRKHYAVALRPGEGDVTPLNAEDRKLLRSTVITGIVDNRRSLDAAIARETGATELWRVLLVLAALLLCAELYLGWRFSG